MNPVPRSAIRRPEPVGQSARWQLSGEYGGDIDGLRRGTLGLWTDNAYRVGVESRWTYWTEARVNASPDRLVLGDANAIFRVFQSPRLQAHAGLGGRLLADPVRGGYRGGFNATASLEAYPVFPLTLRFQADLGNLGAAFCFESQASVGFMWRRAEIYAGYSGMLIDPVPFHGPVVGLRLHF